MFFSVSGEKVMQPYLCEVNFSPDLSVYEKKYPQLTNDIFSTLFLDDTEGRPVKLLSTSWQKILSEYSSMDSWKSGISDDFKYLFKFCLLILYSPK